MSRKYVKVCGTQLLNYQYDHLSVGMNTKDKTWPSVGYICNHTWSTDSQRLQGSQMRSSSRWVCSWRVPPKEAHTLTGQLLSIPSWRVKVLEGLYWTKIPLSVCKLVCWLMSIMGRLSKVSHCFRRVSVYMFWAMSRVPNDPLIHDDH